MNQELHTPYDEVAYEGQPFRRTHPDAIAQVALLFGVTPPDISTARVLELGCGDAANIIPMAFGIPGGTFVGGDLSSQAIKKGQDLASRLGLSNIELHQMSIADIDSSLGDFDYIICHGIYSWVDSTVQAAILRIISERLTSSGIAYVSYNTLPGWKFRGIAREIMRFHSGRHEHAPSLFLHQSRAILEFIAEHASPKDAVYKETLKQQHRTVASLPDWYLFHDYLETNNEALYFSEFTKRAGLTGLQYLGDTELSKLVPQEFTSEVQGLLGKFAGDFVAYEQYLDFLRNRMFRRSLLMKSSVVIKREIHSDWIQNADLATPGILKQGEGNTPVFHHPGGGSIKTDNPLVLKALALLSSRWPQAIPFKELPGADDPKTRNPLAAALLKMLFSELVESRLIQYPATSTLSSKPQAYHPARVYSLQGNTVPTSIHEAAGLSEDDRALLPLLDGTREVDAFIQVLALNDHQAGKNRTPEQLREAVQRILHRFLRDGILVR